jgi:type VI secretion system secreted protein VgrG
MALADKEQRMFAPANTAAFTLDIPGIIHDFKVLAFTGTEAISQPYRFQLELVSERPDLDIEALLQQPAFFSFAGQGKGIHGLIHRVAQGDAGKRLTRYHIDLVPHLAYLGHRTNQRIFQHLSVPEIISRVLADHGIQADAFRFQLNSEYPQRIYCTQYDETDLHFVQRLCEEEGIHYHFEHDIDNHLLVFGDDQTGFPQLDRPTAYIQDSGLVADEPVIKRFAMRIETRPSRVTRRDYDFEKPHLLMEAAHKAEQPAEGDEQPIPLPDLEDYDYPGRFTERARGKQLAKRSLERHRSDYRLAEGKSDVPTLVTGHFLTLSEHPRTEWNDLWLVVSIQHEGKQPQVLEESVTSDVKESDGFTQGYRNQFTAAPWDVHYRPQLDHPKPKLLGTQTAVVTGPKGEEIHCDQYGRIKVQFHWDREGQGDERTSCWLRVASGWAGNQYGGIAIPRVGMEVLVTFLEGDPDQPLVTGCLYHKTHPVPYELPANKTRSVFKTLSSPGGGGYNELRIEDKKDQEQIYIHAQRDWDENIENDQKIRVGNERHDRVEANSYTELLAEEHHTTHSDRKTELKANDHLTIGTSQHVKLGTAQLLEAGEEIHLSSGMKVVLNAGSEITFKVGGSFVKLDPSGVTLVGPSVNINAGGSPGSGSGAAPLMPGDVMNADSDNAGAVLVPAQRQALMQKKPLCAICTREQEGPSGNGA